MTTQASEMLVFERIIEAMNQHDLDAVIACVTPDYISEQPAHPSRSYVGSEQLRTNLGRIFASVPDFRVDLLADGTINDEYWIETRWHGTRADGAAFDLRGVMIFATRDGLISRNRHYFEPVEAGSDVNAGVSSWTGGKK